MSVQDFVCGFIFFVHLFDVSTSRGEVNQGITPNKLVNSDARDFTNGRKRLQNFNWRFYSAESEIEFESSKFESSDSSLLSESETKSRSDGTSRGGSSVETGDEAKAIRAYRTCTPCPREMQLGYKSPKISWVCGRYQRARRSFKSECMMRYRNCEDGTMFVKMYDRRCSDDPYHGKHWFYVYRV